MIYDARNAKKRDPNAIRFPCPVMIVAKQNGERIPNVFWLDTRGVLKRFIADFFGKPLGDAGGARLEVTEFRPWKAVTLDGREVIAESGSEGDAILSTAAEPTNNLVEFERWTGTGWEACGRESCQEVDAVWRSVGGVQVFRTVAPHETPDGSKWFTTERCDSPEDGMTVAQQQERNRIRYFEYMATGQQGYLVL